MIRRVLMVFVVAALVAACGGSGSDTTPTLAPEPTATEDIGCSTKDGQRVYDLLSDVALRWDDAVELADSTPRMQLAAQIENLQEIRREVVGQEWPVCGQQAQEALVAGMDAGIDGFIAFLSDEEDSVVDDHIANYTREMRLFHNALERMSE